jgi:hypothetical protein
MFKKQFKKSDIEEFKKSDIEKFTQIHSINFNNPNNFPINISINVGDYIDFTQASNNNIIFSSMSLPFGAQLPGGSDEILRVCNNQDDFTQLCDDTPGVAPPECMCQISENLLRYSNIRQIFNNPGIIYYYNSFNRNIYGTITVIGLPTTAAIIPPSTTAATGGGTTTPTATADTGGDSGSNNNIVNTGGDSDSDDDSSFPVWAIIIIALVIVVFIAAGIMGGMKGDYSLLP